MHTYSLFLLYLAPPIAEVICMPPSHATCLNLPTIPLSLLMCPGFCFMPGVINFLYPFVL